MVGQSAVGCLQIWVLLLKPRANCVATNGPNRAFKMHCGVTPEIALDRAIEQYEIALALDPQNEIALRRLGQIALSRGELAVAELNVDPGAGICPNPSCYTAAAG